MARAGIEPVDLVESERHAAQENLATLHKYAKGFVEEMEDDFEGDQDEVLAIMEGLRAALVDSEVADSHIAMRSGS